MKKFKYYFSILIIVLISQSIFSQNITNGDFENWSTVNAFEEPNHMITGSIHAFFITGSANTIKSTDKVEGNYSVKLTTKIIGNDTMLGLITNASALQDKPKGGQPYTSKPDSLFYSAKYNIIGNDSAVIGVLFSNNGNPIGFGMEKFNGSQAVWQANSIKIKWFNPLQPDTVLFIAASSNLDGIASNNSEFQIDNVNFGTGNAPLINGGFENWTMKTFVQPNNWSTFNVASIAFPPAYVKKSTDAYHGSYALEMTTQRLNDKDTIAHISNGNIISKNWKGGQRVYTNPMKLTGFYKYTPVGNDKAVVAISTTRWDAVNHQRILIQKKFITLAAASSYTAFSLNLTYNSWPYADTLGIVFGSSNIHNGNNNARLGSKLLLDSLNITYFPVGISENENNNQSINIYPQPAKDFVNFEMENTAQSIKILVYNNNGKLVKSKEINLSNILSLNTSDLSSGVYFYQINIDSRISKGKFQIAK